MPRRKTPHWRQEVSEAIFGSGLLFSLASPTNIFNPRFLFFLKQSFMRQQFPGRNGEGSQTDNYQHLRGTMRSQSSIEAQELRRRNRATSQQTTKGK